ncbi:catecholate siderophore receptor Fiu [mine drainage metagenome]|uniref:Catecholate siderophore receptor Fiu n=1 Tax=mine drainage metagenome TaxID=410659 RepID=A0A1J5SMM9_9ZZZZ
MDIHKTQRYLLASLFALAVGSSLGWSQSVTPKDSKTDDSLSSASDDQTITLDPFTVTAVNEGYEAVDTLGGARVKTKLIDTPSSISVITKKFLSDLNITNAQDLFAYTTGTDVAGLNGTYSGIAARGFGVAQAGESARLANPGGADRARGLTAMDNTRNYFISEIPWDSYNISRVDISRGPNSFLFGVGSPSGIANVSTNEALFKDEGSFQAQVGSFGSTRESLDYNKVLIPKELGLRLDLVNDDTHYQQDPAFNHTKRLYAAVRFDPKALSTRTSHMKIELNYEAGTGLSNNPRELPPLDYISGYFSGSVNKAGYNPWTFDAKNQTGVGGNYYAANAGPWVNNGDIHYAWGGPTYYYNAGNGQLLQAIQGHAGGNMANATSIIGGSAIGGMAGGVSNVYHLYTNGFSMYAQNVNATNPNLYPGANAGTVTYLDKTLSDPSIFDFYNKLIDGPNKREWQGWNAFNATVEESLFNGHIAIQATADHQAYHRGQEGLLLSNMSPYISVNLDQYSLTYPNWISGSSTNPYEGMPFIANDTGGGGNSTSYIHDNYQVTAYGKLDFSEVLQNKELAKILGHHELTLLGGSYDMKQDQRDWATYATDPSFGQAVGAGTSLANNGISWVALLGPSLVNRSTAAGLNLSNLSTHVVPTSGNVSMWNGTWNQPSVNPNATWTYTDSTGATVNTTQLNNPANYMGYTPTYANVLNSTNNIDKLYTSGALSDQKISSLAVMYQGYLLDNTVIPEFGFRRDSVLQRGNQAPMLPGNNLVDMNYNLTDPGAKITTNSTSYGVALHLPKSIRAHLPGDTDVSLYYFHGNNETPQVRYSIDGSALPSENGKTDDYTVRVDTLNGRATLKVTMFKTLDNNAAASYGQPLGAAGWLIDSLPSWTLTMGALGELGAHQPANPWSDWNNNSWIWNWGAQNPQVADQVGAAIQQYFPKLFPQSYWDQYGMGVNVAAIQSGDWAHILSNGQEPLPWNINNTHTIHGVSPTIDQNLESKGYEIEGTFRPVPNWDLTFNASKMKAWQTSLGADASDYLNQMANVWLQTPVGMTAEWGYLNPAGAMKQQFLTGLWAPYLTQVALTGTQQPELSQWNFRGASNYHFDRGTLKGFNVGAAVRWQDAPIIGYGIKQSTIFGQSAWINDTNHPLYGVAETHVDLWVGYERKLTSSINWKIQLNFRNLGEKPHLVPVTAEPDGSYAQERIAEGQIVDLSTTLSF